MSGYIQFQVQQHTLFYLQDHNGFNDKLEIINVVIC